MIPDRIQRIQRHLGTRPDGILGPATISAIEMAIGLDIDGSLRVSRRSVDMLIGFEIGSEARYRRELERPYWPGGASGVTIGIGYDLGYHSLAQLERDWGPHLAELDLKKLGGFQGFRGSAAKMGAAMSTAAPIPIDVAKEVFWTASLPTWAARARRAMPGVELLPPDAQGALLSLCYNRGTSMANTDRRREMREARDDLAALASLPADLQAREAVAPATLRRLAGHVLSMRRLWIGKDLDGLIRRREAEAQLIEGANRDYAPEEVVTL